jgi:hypothetical protein
MAEDLMDAWARAGERVGGAEPAAAETEASPAATTQTTPAPAGKAAAAAAAAAPAPKAEPVLTADERKQLEELAKKHGFEIEGNKVTVAERVAFREERRRAKQALAEQESQVRARLQEELGYTRSQAQAVLAANKAIEEGDFDAFAKALGRKSWNELNTEAIQRFADPNFKRLRDLEQAHREREEREQLELKESQARQQQARQQKIIADYKASLTQEASASSDPFIKAFSDDPRFVHAIYQVQKDHYEKTGEALAIAEAVRRKPSRGGSDLLAEMQTLYSRLKKAFPEGAPVDGANRESAKAESGRAAELPVRTQKVSTSIPQRKATDAAASRPVKVDSNEWMQSAIERMSVAAEADRKSKKA